METESDSSNSYLVIVTKRERLKVFFKTYWRTILLILTGLAFLPLVFLGNSYAYWYVFFVSSMYWMFDVLHPGVTAIIPVALFSLIGYPKILISELHILNSVINCLGVMMIIVAIEHSSIHKRIALKVLLHLGCSHYRLSFVLFFSCMILSMWVSNTMACGLMMPIVKAILDELERMGILEMYHNIIGNKVRQKYSRHDQTVPRPTEFTIFYFLGIAYSSSIGGMTSLIGSQNNQIFKNFLQTMFPEAPKLLFPNFILLTLPGVLLLETLLYLWLNFYFIGMFRAQSEMALEMVISEEESEYIETLLTEQYRQLQKIKFEEVMVSILVTLSLILQATRTDVNGHLTLWSPVLVSVVLLFIVPVKLSFLKFFKKRPDLNKESFPVVPTKACLTWNLVNNNIHWSILLIIGGSCAMFEALRSSHAAVDIEEFLLSMRTWPAPAQALIIIILCKVLTEFAPNACVLCAVLPSVVKLSVLSKVNPLYLMTTATMACTVPFHLIPGTAANAMVTAYVHIPPWKMMRAGTGPTLASIIVIWFTTTLWSRVLWPDINVYPQWADYNHLIHNKV